MKPKFDTIQVHGGHKPDRETYARAVPIYQSSSFVFESAEHAAELFALNQAGNIYTRIGNPTNVVADIAKLAAIAHSHSVPLIVDNTVTTPYLLRPFELGADIVVHSLTKFMGGHGVSIGGVVVDAGKFDFSSWERFGRPDESQHGLVYTEKFGAAAYIARLRTVVLRDTGACLSPFNAFTLLLGVETLSLRMQRHCANALAVAEFLEARNDIAWVNYPGLSSHRDHALAGRILPKGAGAIIAFAPQGGYERAKTIVDSVKLFSHLANIGDAKSLIIHPASTTHQQLSTEQQLAAGVSPDLIRLSIGIEDLGDLLEDLTEGLKA